MKSFLKIVLCFLILAFVYSPSSADNNFVLMASTIGPVDSGVVDALENEFFKDTGIIVRHVSAGTGAALDMARNCQIDIVLVHAKELEDKFISQGYGTTRMPLMYNDFVIVGPAEDPAGIKGMKSAASAFEKIQKNQSKFLTRADKSGTNIAEMNVWKIAGITPAGAWYVKGEKGAQGNTATLIETSDIQAYTIIDRATWLAAGSKTKLSVLVEGDEVLINHISIIPVSAKKCSSVNDISALKFAKWLTDVSSGQRIIEVFGKDKYGQPLFVPESEAYKSLIKNK